MIGVGAVIGMTLAMLGNTTANGAETGAAQVQEEALDRTILEIREAAVSRDGRHAAEIVIRREGMEGTKQVVLLDGQQIIPSQRLDHPVQGLVFHGDHLAYSIGGNLFVDKEPLRQPSAFSPDDEHFASATLKGSGWTVEVDGQALFELDDVAGRFGTSTVGSLRAGQKLLFCPGGKHVACALWRTGSALVATDVQAWPALDAALGIGPIALSSDGRHVAYAVQTIPHPQLAGKWCVVVDGQAGPAEFSAVQSVVMSFDGQHVAYCGNVGNKWVVVRDGQRSPGYDGIGTLVMSPDGKLVTYSTQKAGKWVVVTNGQAGPEFDRIGPFIVSPDGTRVAYAGAKADGWVAVTDGHPGPRYDWIRADTLRFTGDSKHVVYAGLRNETWTVITDGQAGPECADFDLLTMNPSGKGFVYAAQRGTERWGVVTDGQMGPEFNRIVSVCFSPDGSRMAYVAARGSNWVVVVDGVSYQGTDAARNVVFSPDNRHVAYVGSKSGEPPSEYVVLDGRPGPEYGHIISGPTFRSDATVEYLSVKGRNLYRVKHSLQAVTPKGK